MPLIYPDPYSLLFKDLVANLQFWERQGYVWKEGWSCFWLEVGRDPQSFETFTSLPWVQKEMVRRCSGSRSVWTREALLCVQFKTLPIKNIVIAHNVPLLQRIFLTPTQKRIALRESIHHGKVKCLRYMLGVTPKPLVWPRLSLEKLVSRGYLKCLKVALRHDLAWDPNVTTLVRSKAILNFICKHQLPVCEGTLSSLLKHGSDDLFEVGLSSLGLARPNQDFLRGLAKFGNLSKLKIIVKNKDLVLDWPVDFVSFCAARNDLPMIQVALRHGAEWEIKASMVAAQFNFKKIIDFALKNQFLLHPDTTLKAAKHGHEQLFQELWHNPNVWRHPALGP